MELYRRVRQRGRQAIASLARHFGYRIQRLDRWNHLEPLLYRRLAKAPNLFFVQIGANDGVFNDPIWPFVTRNRVAGLVVEPLHDMFAKLVANYRPYPNVTPVNTAIHATLKSVQMYRVDPAKASQVIDWAQGIGSIKPGHHVKAGVPSEAMLVETVPSMTLDELLQRHGVKAIDLLQIDTEGYDAEILRMIDFDRYKPAIIQFEHGMPSGTMSPQEFKACATLLMDHGYSIVTDHFDAVAYRPETV